ncbi:hypothetical protein J6590_036298 [Homalodisca vitripennis]|nr:hypothetical protein J6590_036298 [Homalodisca vitripennis]
MSTIRIKNRKGIQPNPLQVLHYTGLQRFSYYYTAPITATTTIAILEIRVTCNSAALYPVDPKINSSSFVQEETTYQVIKSYRTDRQQHNIRRNCWVLNSDKQVQSPM